MDALKRIKQLMDERGWSEYKLAKEAGLSQSTISNMFHRTTSPTIPTLETLCKAFGITLSQFFSEGNEAIELTDEQREMFEHWVNLTSEQKQLLFDLMKNMK